MKQYLNLLFLFFCMVGHAQAWTPEQLAKANTGKDAIFLSTIEKETIKYINLARLYPKQFAKLEVENYTGTSKYPGYVKNSPQKKSLISFLNSTKSLVVLSPNKEMFENAKCWAIESGDKGIEGHTRIKCPKKNFAECCSYGMENGRDIAMQWLIDDKVASLGHRKICLDPKYSKIGPAYHTHTKWGTCCVSEFI